MTEQVVAILCSDIHLSHRAPAARSAEPDWYAAMDRNLQQVWDLLDEHDREPPVICAGDVFDRWSTSPELVNFVLDKLPDLHAVPGQHDLPNHRLGDLGRSAFGTLMRTVQLTPIWFNKGTLEKVGGRHLAMSGFPFGSEWKDWSGCFSKESLRVAVVHKYVYMDGMEYPGVDPSGHVEVVREKLKGFDVVVSGDNHRAFISEGKPVIVNPGCLIPRRSEERWYKPCVGLLWSDGSVELKELDTSQDKWVGEQGVEVGQHVASAQLKEFLSGLKELSADQLDFRHAVHRYLADSSVDESVRKVMLEVVG